MSQSIHPTTRGWEHTLSCLCPKCLVTQMGISCPLPCICTYLVWPHPFLNALWMGWDVQFSTFVAGRWELYLSHKPSYLAGVWLLAIPCYSLPNWANYLVVLNYSSKEKWCCFPCSIGWLFFHENMIECFKNLVFFSLFMSSIIYFFLLSILYWNFSSWNRKICFQTRCT